MGADGSALQLRPRIACRPVNRTSRSRLHCNHMAAGLWRRPKARLVQPKLIASGHDHFALSERSQHRVLQEIFGIRAVAAEAGRESDSLSISATSSEFSKVMAKPSVGVDPSQHRPDKPHDNCQDSARAPFGLGSMPWHGTAAAFPPDGDDPSRKRGWSLRASRASPAGRRTLLPLEGLRSLPVG